MVLLGQERHDGGGDGVGRPVGAAAGCLEQFGTWPHQFQVWLAKVMPAVCNNTAPSQLHGHVAATNLTAFGLGESRQL